MNIKEIDNLRNLINKLEIEVTAKNPENKEVGKRLIDVHLFTEELMNDFILNS